MITIPWLAVYFKLPLYLFHVWLDLRLVRKMEQNIYIKNYTVGENNNNFTYFDA